MYIQTIGLSVIRRKNLPILKISPNFITFSSGGRLLRCE